MGFKPSCQPSCFCIEILQLGTSFILFGAFVVFGLITHNLLNLSFICPWEITRVGASDGVHGEYFCLSHIRIFLTYFYSNKKI